jgi:hypothetical protein
MSQKGKAQRPDDPNQGPEEEGSEEEGPEQEGPDRIEALRTQT